MTWCSTAATCSRRGTTARRGSTSRAATPSTTPTACAAGGAMTLGSDDLPAAGPQQVICSCLATRFDVVLDGGTVKAVCPAGHVAGAWAVDGAVDSGHLVTGERDVPLEYRQ